MHWFLPSKFITEMILLQWNYDQYCLRPKKRKTSSQKSSLLTLALYNIWQQMYYCKGISLWCLSFARFTELRNLDSVDEKYFQLGEQAVYKVQRCYAAFLSSWPYPFHLRSDAEAPVQEIAQTSLNNTSVGRSQNAAWLPGGRKLCFWEIIPSAPHPKTSGRPVSYFRFNLSSEKSQDEHEQSVFRLQDQVMIGSIEDYCSRRHNKMLWSSWTVWKYQGGREAGAHPVIPLEKLEFNNQKRSY